MDMKPICYAWICGYDFVLVLFLNAMIKKQNKIPQEKSAQGMKDLFEITIPGYSSSLRGKSRQQEPEAASYIHSREQRENACTSCSALSPLLYIVQDSSIGNSAALRQTASSHIHRHHPDKPSQRCPEVYQTYFAAH